MPPTVTTEPGAVNVAVNAVTFVPYGNVTAILLPGITPAEPFIENAVTTGAAPLGVGLGTGALGTPPPLPPPHPFKIKTQVKNTMPNAAFNTLITILLLINSTTMLKKNL